jgi:hypothetical protein
MFQLGIFGFRFFFPEKLMKKKKKKMKKKKDKIYDKVASK